MSNQPDALLVKNEFKYFVVILFVFYNLFKLLLSVFITAQIIIFFTEINLTYFIPKIKTIHFFVNKHFLLYILFELLIYSAQFFINILAYAKFKKKKKIKENFTQFSKELSKLPRITREFYAFLLERREDDEDSPSNSYFCECFYFNYNKLKRICNFPNLNEELTILEEHRLVDIQEAIEDGSPFVRIFATKVDIDNFIYDLVSYIEHKDIGYRKPIVSLDFSEF